MWLSAFYKSLIVIVLDWAKVQENRDNPVTFISVIAK